MQRLLKPGFGTVANAPEKTCIIHLSTSNSKLWQVPEPINCTSSLSDNDGNPGTRNQAYGIVVQKEKKHAMRSHDHFLP
jgi:hypothetical protein